eukprot:TRINITY_DN103430_c0_g1_i1.p1 TRINITY_DN103430_c0_g1~~TRINITY_DN103430_c0_g1_i1.p1  ORF type:complete len:166 (-),score=39.35 TRINITY_DN103430_c0_g1_i1:108-605(-)
MLCQISRLAAALALTTRVLAVRVDDDPPDVAHATGAAASSAAPPCPVNTAEQVDEQTQKDIESIKHAADYEVARIKKRDCKSIQYWKKRTLEAEDRKKDHLAGVRESMDKNDAAGQAAQQAILAADAAARAMGIVTNSSDSNSSNSSNASSSAAEKGSEGDEKAG